MPTRPRNWSPTSCRSALPPGDQRPNYGVLRVAGRGCRHQTQPQSTCSASAARQTVAQSRLTVEDADGDRYLVSRQFDSRGGRVARGFRHRARRPARPGQVRPVCRSVGMCPRWPFLWRWTRPERRARYRARSTGLGRWLSARRRRRERDRPVSWRAGPAGSRNGSSFSIRPSAWWPIKRFDRSKGKTSGSSVCCAHLRARIDRFDIMDMSLAISHRIVVLAAVLAAFATGGASAAIVASMQRSSAASLGGDHHRASDRNHVQLDGCRARSVPTSWRYHDCNRCRYV